jgi:thiamine biosynthesis lipoprotein
MSSVTMQTINFKAMGSHMVAILDEVAGPEARAALEEVPAWFEEWEEVLSRFRTQSELTRLNHSGGEAVPVSAVLWDVLEKALQAARDTGGIVSPAVLPALEASGYDRTFGLIVSRPASDAALSAPWSPGEDDWRGIRLDPKTRSVCLPPDVRIDLGGVAKGWAADQAVTRLSQFGPALVDAGGDISVSGPRADGEPWPIGVDDPANPEAMVAMLAVRSGGVATSGRDFRRWRQGARWRHHIIDPRTGLPAQTDVMTATVIAPDAAQAEVAAKVALILGSKDGLDWIDARPELAALVVLEDGTVLKSDRIGAHLWP